MVKRITALTAEQRGRMEEWADRWIAIGLSTERADWERFEMAARACYRYAGLPGPRVVVRVSSPLVMALAAPMAAHILDRGHGAVDGAVAGVVDGAVAEAVEAEVYGAVADAVHGAVAEAVEAEVYGAVEAEVYGAVGGVVGGVVHGAVHGVVAEAVEAEVYGAVGGAVADAVAGAVGGAVRDAVAGAVRDAVHGVVGGVVDGAVADAVHGAVDEAVEAEVYGAVRDAVAGVVGDAPHVALRDAVARNWSKYFGGQFWVGGWWGNPAYVSYFLDVCGLELPDDYADRARAYAATTESACWWWPHRDFVMVSDRPLAIHTELTDPRRPRGRGSHRLHNADGPAIVWPDGFGVWSWHGVRAPRWVIETPIEGITAGQVVDEPNAEVRRVLIERIGTARYLSLAGGTLVARDDWGSLWDIARPDRMRVVELTNSTPGPDGIAKHTWHPVPHTSERAQADRCLACGSDLAIVPQTPREAVAWGYGVCVDDYRPSAQT